MPKLPNKGGPDRVGKRSPRARPDRIIEKRAKWEDYLDPDEDPGLLDEDEDADWRKARRRRVRRGRQGGIEVRRKAKP